MHNLYAKFTNFLEICKLFFHNLVNDTRHTAFSFTGVKGVITSLYFIRS